MITLIQTTSRSMCGNCRQNLNRKLVTFLSITPLWREAYFEVEMYQTPQLQGSFQKVDAVVVRSIFRSQNVKNLFWKLRCKKSARLVARSTFGRQKCCGLTVSEHFVRGNGFCILSKVSQTYGRRGTFEEDASACRVAGAVQETYESGGPGADFLRWGCILEHQIFRLAKMILRDRCSTSYDLASLVCGRCSILDTWNGKIAKRIGTRPSALHSTFHFWRKSRRIASFSPLSKSKIEEVSHPFRPSNCLCIYLLYIFLSICLSDYYLSVCLSACPPDYLAVYLSNYLSVCLSACPPDYLAIYLSNYLYVYLPVHLTIWLSIYLSS